MKNLGTTSYAILGLLAIQPWTTYELAQQLRRNLHYFWPRAESGVYEEPKNLVRHGLAEARRETVGRRPRTVYMITDAGRSALADWLEGDSEPWTLFSEALVRLWFADHGGESALRKAIGALRAQAQATLSHGRAIAREYASSDTPPFPERLAINAMIFRFVWDYAATIAKWADWAEFFCREPAGSSPARRWAGCLSPSCKSSVESGLCPQAMNVSGKRTAQAPSARLEQAADQLCASSHLHGPS
jgi:DNA-binding PadR family transcriptional regulator